MAAELIAKQSSSQDRLFAVARTRAADFRFDAETAAVFDDMLDRSVPFYDEIQRMVGELAGDFAAEGSIVYDLGCSTGGSFLAVAPHIEPSRNVRFVGLDSSPDMLARARQKLHEAHFPHPFELRVADLDRAVDVTGGSVVLLVLTLQFVRPLHRDRLLASIHRDLRPGGILILVEKVLGEHSPFNRAFIEHYYDYKRRNGYSDLEIAQKREALENVLVPYRLEENRELLARAGFNQTDVFFKWYNFCGIVALKTPDAPQAAR